MSSFRLVLLICETCSTLHRATTQRLIQWSVTQHSSRSSVREVPILAVYNLYREVCHRTYCDVSTQGTVHSHINKTERMVSSKGNKRMVGSTLVSVLGLCLSNPLRQLLRRLKKMRYSTRFRCRLLGQLHSNCFGITPYTVIPSVIVHQSLT